MEPEAKKARLETDAISKPTFRVDNQYDDISCDSTPVTKETDNIEVSSSNSQTEEVKFVKETDVGILCYINDLPGCHGVIKQRYVPQKMILLLLLLCIKKKKIFGRESMTLVSHAVYMYDKTTMVLPNEMVMLKCHGLKLKCIFYLAMMRWWHCDANTVDSFAEVH